MKKTWFKNIKELKFCSKNPETLVTLCIEDTFNFSRSFGYLLD